MKRTLQSSSARAPTHPGGRTGIRWWDRQGLRGGLLASIGFAVVELVAMDLQRGQAEVARFLRRIAAMWIGPEVLASDYPFAIVAVVGTVMHLSLAALFGLVFAWLTEAHVRRLVRVRGALLAVDSIYGLLLWPLNVYLIAPVVGWSWFAAETEPSVLAAAHLCYGVVLGLYLDHRVRERARGLWISARRERGPVGAASPSQGRVTRRGPLLGHPRRVGPRFHN